MRGWLVVHCAAKKELSLWRRAQADGYTCFLPMHRKWAKLNGRGDRKVSEQPLFPGYLFLECDLERIPDTTPWAKDGAIEFLKFAGSQKPHVVPLRFIEMLSIAQGEGLHDETKEISRLSIGSPVHVQHGPYSGHIGKLAGMKGSDRVLVLLSIFGAEREAELELAHVRALC